ncbi:MAG: hypothetical protein NT085_03305 [candidate division SR1 bacterium]|nr:hypothetical protein [candidate division SR1 bacterium]
MDANLLITLQNYGLSEKEARIYLTAVELGPTVASTIARNSGEKRVTTYTLLKELIKKGYMNEIKRNDISYFSSISPEILFKELEKKYLSFKETLPDFLSVFEKFGNTTKIQFFEGDEGLNKMFMEFTNTTINMKTILGTPKYYNKTLLKASEYYRRERKRKGLISMRLISPHNVDQKKEKEDDKKYGRKTVIVEDFPFDIKADINIFGPNKVSFLFFENNIPQAVVITSEHMYNCLNAIFDYIWKVNAKSKK